MSLLTDGPLKFNEKLFIVDNRTQESVDILPNKWTLLLKITNMWTFRSINVQR